MLTPDSCVALDQDTAAAVAKAVQERWAALPKTGKPQPHEDTVLAGFALTGVSAENGSGNNNPAAPLVIALGSGTKCLGALKRSSAGDVLNDSHAEVIARRALLAWLYDQMELALQDHTHQQQRQQQQQQQQQQQEGEQLQPTGKHRLEGNCKQQLPLLTWCPSTGCFSLAAGVCLHLYVSQPPCGDASIHDDSSSIGTTIAGLAAPGACLQPHDDAAAAPCASTAQPCAIAAAGPSSGRTGAKLIRTTGARDVHDAAVAVAAAAAANSQPATALAVPQAHEVEAGAQQQGAARRKPGRGDATLSMSCSDKLARWACLGLQGCLLSAVLKEPLRLSSVVVSLPGATAAPAGGGEAGQEGHSGLDAAASQAARQALSRALNGRMQEGAQRLQAPFCWCPPKVAVVQPPPAALALAPTAVRKVPSGVSINWSAAVAELQQPHGAKAALEVTLAADGRKAGTGKKGPAWTSAKTRSRLCSIALLQRYVGLLEHCEAAQLAASKGAGQLGQAAGVTAAQARTLPYGVLKQRAGAGYQAAWAQLRHAPSPLAAWLLKPQAAFVAGTQKGD